MDRIDPHAGTYLISAVIRAMGILRPDGRDIEYKFSVLPRRWGGIMARDSDLTPADIAEKALQLYIRQVEINRAKTKSPVRNDQVKLKAVSGGK